MTENLRTSKYRDGSIIPNETVDATWAALKTGAWCDYDNDAANDTKYGKLYNWYAVNDNRNIAPVGWHVPTDAEWTTLTNYVATHYGTSISTSKALAATTNWTTSSGNIGNIGWNLAINNYSGFSALPGGYRNYNSGTFFGVGYNGYWWSSTEYDTNKASLGTWNLAATM